MKSDDYFLIGCISISKPIAFNTSINEARRGFPFFESMRYKFCLFKFVSSAKSAMVPPLASNTSRKANKKLVHLHRQVPPLNKRLLPVNLANALLGTLVSFYNFFFFFLSFSVPSIIKPIAVCLLYIPLLTSFISPNKIWHMILNSAVNFGYTSVENAGYVSMPPLQVQGVPNVKSTLHLDRLNVK